MANEDESVFVIEGNEPMEAEATTTTANSLVVENTETTIDVDSGHMANTTARRIKKRKKKLKKKKKVDSSSSELDSEDEKNAKQKWESLYYDFQKVFHQKNGFYYTEGSSKFIKAYYKKYCLNNNNEISSSDVIDTRTGSVPKPENDSLESPSNAVPQKEHDTTSQSANLSTVVQNQPESPVDGNADSDSEGVPILFDSSLSKELEKTVPIIPTSPTLNSPWKNPMIWPSHTSASPLLDRVGVNISLPSGVMSYQSPLFTQIHPPPPIFSLPKLPTSSVNTHVNAPPMNLFQQQQSSMSNKDPVLNWFTPANEDKLGNSTILTNGTFDSISSSIVPPKPPMMLPPPPNVCNATQSLPTFPPLPMPNFLFPPPPILSSSSLSNELTNMTSLSSNSSFEMPIPSQLPPPAHPPFNGLGPVTTSCSSLTSSVMSPFTYVATPPIKSDSFQQSTTTSASSSSTLYHPHNGNTGPKTSSHNSRHSNSKSRYSQYANNNYDPTPPNLPSLNRYDQIDNRNQYFQAQGLKDDWQYMEEEKNRMKELELEIANRKIRAAVAVSQKMQEEQEFQQNKLAQEKEMEKKRLKKQLKDEPSVYETIESNQYTFLADDKNFGVMKCNCGVDQDDLSPSSINGCQENCLNRMLFIECDSECDLGDSCTNRNFQNAKCPSMEVFKTEKKGWGLKVLEEVTAGSFVIEFVGEVIKKCEVSSKLKAYKKQGLKHHYMMALTAEEVVDSTKKGNLSRFINHSCQPNCEIQKWTVSGEWRLGVFAVENIGSDEEITIDYQFESYGRKVQQCFCDCKDISKCRRVIGFASTNDSSERDNKVNNEHDEKKRRSKDVNLFLESLSAGNENNKVISNNGQMTKLVRLLLRAEDNDQRTALLNVIMNTNSSEIFVQFRNMHGLPILQSFICETWAMKCLREKLTALSNPEQQFSEFDEKADDENSYCNSLFSFIRICLQLLQKIPLKCRSQVEGTKVEEWVQKIVKDLNWATDFCSENNDEIDGSVEMRVRREQCDDSEINVPKIKGIFDMAQNIITKWKSLKHEYKIPKKDVKKLDPNRILDQVSSGVFTLDAIPEILPGVKRDDIEKGFRKEENESSRLSRSFDESLHERCTWLDSPKSLKTRKRRLSFHNFPVTTCSSRSSSLGDNNMSQERRSFKRRKRNASVDISHVLDQVSKEFNSSKESVAPAKKILRRSTSSDDISTNVKCHESQIELPVISESSPLDKYPLNDIRPETDPCVSEPSHCENKDIASENIITDACSNTADTESQNKSTSSSFNLEDNNFYSKDDSEENSSRDILCSQPGRNLMQEESTESSKIVTVSTEPTKTRTEVDEVSVDAKSDLEQKSSSDQLNTNNESKSNEEAEISKNVTLVHDNKTNCLSPIVATTITTQSPLVLQPGQIILIQTTDGLVPQQVSIPIATLTPSRDIATSVTVTPSAITTAHSNSEDSFKSSTSHSTTVLLATTGTQEQTQNLAHCILPAVSNSIIYNDINSSETKLLNTSNCEEASIQSKNEVLDSTKPEIPQKLPKNWRSAVDTSNGKTYYYHAITRQTQWAFPIASGPDDYSSSSEEESESEDEHDTMDKNNSSATVGGVDHMGEETTENIYDIPDTVLDGLDSVVASHCGNVAASNDSFNVELFSSHSIHTPPEPFSENIVTSAAISYDSNSSASTVSSQYNSFNSQLSNLILQTSSVANKSTTSLGVPIKHSTPAKSGFNSCNNDLDDKVAALSYLSSIVSSNSNNLSANNKLSSSSNSYPIVNTTKHDRLNTNKGANMLSGGNGLHNNRGGSISRHQSSHSVNYKNHHGRQSSSTNASLGTSRGRHHVSSNSNVSRMRSSGSGQTISNGAKQAREEFREKMSKIVVQCLNSYLRSDCKVGRIRSADDFKYLARKLVHFIVDKEFTKSKRAPEKLKMTAEIAEKARTYIKSYMISVGPEYRINSAKSPK